MRQSYGERSRLPHGDYVTAILLIFNTPQILNTLILTLKLLIISIKPIKSDYFRFKPEVRGRVSKLMILLDSACPITPILTLTSLLIS